MADCYRKWTKLRSSWG